jgi:CTP-dependent riboflavin kinase
VGGPRWGQKFMYYIKKIEAEGSKDKDYFRKNIRITRTLGEETAGDYIGSLEVWYNQGRVIIGFEERYGHYVTRLKDFSKLERKIKKLKKVLINYFKGKNKKDFEALTFALEINQISELEDILYVKSQLRVK